MEGTRNTDNVALSTAVCTTCPSGSYPSPDISSCIQCPQPGMIANQAATGQYSCSCNSTMGYYAQPVGTECINATAKLPIISSTTISYTVC
ncbi:hypothetical protein BDR26DRAFT_797997 [Obelidium mucronatum]|nr:hypothetical protein BDR26DRAFT_797997 [Obelidium mucronatum]